MDIRSLLYIINNDVMKVFLGGEPVLTGAGPWLQSVKAGEPTATERAAASVKVTECPNHSNASDPSDGRYE